MQEIIDKIFYDYQQTEEYAQAFKQIPRRAEIQAAEDTLAELSNNDPAVYDELDRIFGGALCAMEDFGFVQGFKFAMRLRNECNNIGGNL